MSYRRHLVALACWWTLGLAASLAWSLIEIRKEVRSVTAQTARALLEKDVFYREWSILHGGVYVPVRNTAGSAAAAADAADPERTIRTASGLVLTLLNPAQVSRQIFQLQRTTMDIRGHLASLRPYNMANLPDAWERQALELLPQHGDDTTTNEVSSIETREGKPYFRMMRPLFTNPSCLRCHEEAGREVGTQRGGISAMIPMSHFETPGKATTVAFAHLGLWLLGLTGLTLGVRDLERQAVARQRAEAEARQVAGDLKEALDEVKTLSGLIPICASCKKIRDDRGYWTAIEAYMEARSDLRFSHGLCVECLHKLYPEVADAVMRQLASHPSPTPADKATVPAPSAPSPRG